METPARTPAARRTEYLRGLADEALAAEDASKAILSAAEAAKETDTRRRLALGNTAIRCRLDRLKAVGRAEKATKAFVAAVEDVIDHALHERAALAGLGEPGEMLTPPSITRRLARYWSHEMRNVDRRMSTKFGEVHLANYFRASVDWTTAEKQVTSARPGREGNGAIEDQPDNTGDDK